MCTQQQRSVSEPIPQLQASLRLPNMPSHDLPQPIQIFAADWPCSDLQNSTVVALCTHFAGLLAQHLEKSGGTQHLSLSAVLALSLSTRGLVPCAVYSLGLCAPRHQQQHGAAM